MAVGRRDSSVSILIKRLIMVCLLVMAGSAIKNYFWPTVVDVTAMVDMEKPDVERMLGVTLVDNPDMVKKIYEWTDSKITTDSDGDIAIVYIDGKRKGMHIDHKRYSMYGLKIGDLMIDVDKLITYDYEDSFIVMNDEGVGMSTAVHYYNKKKNDCLVVIYNDNSSRIVALTYFNDLKKMSERLDGF